MFVYVGRGGVIIGGAAGEGCVEGGGRKRRYIWQFSAAVVSLGDICFRSVPLIS